MRTAARPLIAAALSIVAACDPDVIIGHLAGDDSPPSPDAALVGPRSELFWLSGAHSGNEIENLQAFASFRGRPLDVAMFFVDRTVGWDGLVQPGWPVDAFTAVEGRMMLAEPLYPEGIGNNQDCARGLYDEEWRMLGPFLEARGRGDSIIRLGWGPNDAAHEWRADSAPDDWIRCFQRVADAIRSTGPGLQIAWDFNPAGRPDNTGLDPWTAYPGDGYIDFLGIEAFDRYPPTRDEQAWNDKCSAPTGLCTVIDFAREHGIRLGLSEWGVVSCGEGGGGDNPFFVEKMFDTFAANPDVMGFEIYYEERVDLCTALAGESQNPLSSARYQALYAPP